MDTFHSTVAERVRCSLGAQAIIDAFCGDRTLLVRLLLNGTDVFAKVFLERSVDAVRLEAKLLRTLESSVFPTTKLVSFADDDMIVIDVESDLVPVLVTHTLNGEPPKDIGLQFAAAMGRQLGDLHALLAAHVSTFSRFGAATNIKLPPRDECADLSRTTRDLLELFETLVPQDAGEKRVIVHGDCRLANWIKGADGTLSLIDFSDAHLGEPSEDLGSMLHLLCLAVGPESGLLLGEKHALPAYLSAHPNGATHQAALCGALQHAARRALSFHLRASTPDSVALNADLASFYLRELATRTYRQQNASGWNELVASGHRYCEPYADEELQRAPEILDPYGWIDWAKDLRVLLLGGGGGQHSLLLASLGCEVVVVDLSSRQLEVDVETAERHGLSIQTICADQADLEDLGLASFDLVFHAMSAHYVPDLVPVFRGVAKCLSPTGIYVGHHRNPLISRVDRRFDEGYRIIRSHADDTPWAGGGIWSLNGDTKNLGTVQFVHSLERLLGSVCGAGLVIDAFAERSAPSTVTEIGSRAHLHSYVPSAIWFRARHTGFFRGENG